MAVKTIAQNWREDPETFTLVKERVEKDNSEGVRSVAVHELAQNWKEQPETLGIAPTRACLASGSGFFSAKNRYLT